VDDVLAEARHRGVSRLCHVTSAGNFAHILAVGEIRDMKELEKSADAYRPADDKRRDGHLEHICCSIEYPNTWYLNKARERQPNFPDWVILTLDIDILRTPGIKFCPYNAARNKGKGVHSGADAFRSLYSDSVLGRTRMSSHPSWWPTDDQAEVLVPGPIPVSNVRSVIVKDTEQARLEHFRLTNFLTTPQNIPQFIVAPTLFDASKLSESVRSGLRPAEFLHIPATL
jgi:hypothetical protein